jgi:hypothetical protein
MTADDSKHHNHLLEFWRLGGEAEDMDTTPTTTPMDLAGAYFAAWESKDADAFRALLADDVSFQGPLATLHDADEAVAGLMGLAEATTALVVRKRLADDADVITWFDLTVGDSGPVPTVNWSHVEGGLITAIRVAFDPRPLLPG